MAAPKFKKNSVEQTIDLKELFGVTFKNAPALKEAIGQKIIDRIIRRTNAGRGLSFDSSGKAQTVKLKSPYSKAYVASDDFKAFGKSKSKVNMKLTGDMLGLMDIKKQTGDTITIGWNSGDDQDAKAYNHSVGDTVPRRPFFGVSRTDLMKIKADMDDEVKSALKIKQEEGKSAFNDFVLGLIKEIKDEE